MSICQFLLRTRHFARHLGDKRRNTDSISLFTEFLDQSGKQMTIMLFIRNTYLIVQMTKYISYIFFVMVHGSHLAPTSPKPWNFLSDKSHGIRLSPLSSVPGRHFREGGSGAIQGWGLGAGRTSLVMRGREFSVPLGLPGKGEELEAESVAIGQWLVMEQSLH